MGLEFLKQLLGEFVKKKDVAAVGTQGKEISFLTYRVQRNGVSLPPKNGCFY